MRNRRAPPRRFAGLAALAAGVLLSAPAWATEGGASFYLLGSGGPQAAVLPPLKGVYFANTFFYYDGASRLDKPLIYNGNILANVKGTIAADFPTVLVAPWQSVLGGNFVAGLAIPFGHVSVDGNVVLTGPLGNQIGLSRGDDAFVVGDPVLSVAQGWTRGVVHFDIANLLNVPIGDYREGKAANLAFHRWADDLSFAVTRLDPKDGWDLSAKTGFTFNGENPATDYRTGTEWHLEAAVEKQITPAWALGVQAYQFSQVSGDSGSGAKLGPFEGRVTGVGGEAAYSFTVGKTPVTLRLHGTSEFNASNRLQGHSIWFDLSLPLHMQLPAGRPG